MSDNAPKMFVRFLGELNPGVHEVNEIDFENREVFFLHGDGTRAGIVASFDDVEFLPCIDYTNSVEFKSEIPVVPAVRCVRDNKLIEIENCMECSHCVNRTQIIANGGLNYGKVYCKYWDKDIAEMQNKKRRESGISPWYYKET